MLRVLFFLSLALMATACRESENMKVLENADKVMEEYPDSALSLLNTIDASTLKGKKEKAYYALLITQARVKNHIIVTNDSLINIAADYFENNGNDFNKMRSQFYKSQVNFYGGDRNVSIKEALKASKIAQKLDDHYWMAKTYELIADNYRLSYNIEKNHEFLLKTIEEYKKAEKRLNELYSICDLSDIYNDKNDYKMAEFLADSIFRIAKYELNDSNLMAYSMFFLFSIYKKHMNWDKIMILEKEEAVLFPRSITEIDLLIYQSRKKWMNNEFNEATQLLDSAANLAEDNLHLNPVIIEFANLYSKKGDYLMAEIYTDSALRIQNKLVREELSQSILLSENKYYRQLSDVSEEKNKALTQTLVISAIAFVFICTVIIVISRLIVRNRNLTLENQMFGIKDLSDKLLSADHKINELSNVISTHEKNSLKEPDKLMVNKEKWQLLNKLCEDFLDENTNEENQKALLKTFKKEIKTLKSAASLKQMEQFINETHDNIIMKLREEQPSIDEDDIRILIFSLSGLSTRAICAILEMKRNTFYSRRRRIMNKIAPVQN